MKIIKAEIYEMSLALSEVYRKYGTWHPVILRLTTDDGVTGLGEAGLAYGVGHRGAIGSLRDFLEKFVIGCDPFDREVVWDHMHTRSFWGSAIGPVICSAMSAVDIALWDIVGKSLDQPIWRLLGGRVQESLRCYASQIQFGWSGDGGWELLSRAEDYAEAAAQAVKEGYDCVKVDPLQLTEDGAMGSPLHTKGLLDNRIIRRVRTRMEAIREAVGDETDIILELHSLTSLSGGQQLAEACADLRLFMVEEAVNYGSDRPSKFLKQRLPHVAIAAGERIFTRWQYRGYLEDQSLDVIQPDFCLVGGITEGKKICDMAHAYDVTVQGHICGSPISTAAAMHVETAIPNFQIHEHHVNATCRPNRDICVQDPQPVNGRMRASDAPGLGLDLNDDYVSKHSQLTVVK